MLYNEIVYFVQSSFLYLLTYVVDFFFPVCVSFLLDLFLTLFFNVFHSPNAMQPSRILCYFIKMFINEKQLRIFLSHSSWIYFCSIIGPAGDMRDDVIVWPKRIHLTWLYRHVRSMYDRHSVTESIGWNWVHYMEVEKDRVRALICVCVCVCSSIVTRSNSGKNWKIVLSS